VLLRLRAGRSAGLITPIDRAAAVGRPHLLVNERLTKSADARAWAVVRVKAGVQIASPSRLDPTQQEGLDDVTRREFVARAKAGEGPFWYHPIVLVRALHSPRRLSTKVERQPGESVSACVSRKIPMLVREGMSPDQAVAAAHRMCGAPKPAEKSAAPRAVVVRKMRLVKAEGREAEDERFVLGVVLEPEVEDSQQDIYSAAEVRKACHDYMASAAQIGLMHQELLSQGARILENYLAPVDFAMNGQTIKAGTWLQGIRILDDAVWEAVKAGKLTGLSIGGSAVRVPEQQEATRGNSA
jgi:hypothetical protein